MGTNQSSQSIGLKKEIQVQSNWANTLPLNHSITKESLGLAEYVVEENIDDIFVIKSIFSREECHELLKAAEAFGFGETDYPKAYRGNLRLITYDISLSELVWSRLKDFLPIEVDERGAKFSVVGLNECWRIAKYFPGDQFDKHVDGCYSADAGTLKSMFTVNIYMNDDFDGGKTTFYLEDADCDEGIDIHPAPGKCLVFRQPPTKRYVHKGHTVVSGIKYLLRTDVNYRAL
mmetsp:Transcript_3134/g.4338  ORF Transcript_3134/g.4338 Transcript_3134/m.4338 type:complete len:232 (+) Transcript_3134:52-747(+)